MPGSSNLAARYDRAASFCVSSPKSVGEFGFREIAETVIQGDFNGFVGPLTIFSHFSTPIPDAHPKRANKPFTLANPICRT